MDEEEKRAQYEHIVWMVQRMVQLELPPDFTGLKPETEELMQMIKCELAEIIGVSIPE